jgi:soluble lytic murein transglycosylase-like protein
MYRRLVPLLLGIALFVPFAAWSETDAASDKSASTTASESTAATTSEAPSAPRPPSKPAPGKAEITPLIHGAAKRHGVELALVKAVVAAESAYDAHAVSHAGAIGLMQLMPATAADYGVRDATQLFDPKVNLEAGVRHLRRLLSKYRNDYGRVIMAYNAGEGVVDRTNSNVTYSETLAYTEAVIRHYRRNGGTKPTEDALRKVRLLRSMKNKGRAKELLAQYLDLDLPELKSHHTRTIRLVDPGLHADGPKRRPMIVLEPRKSN